MAGETTLTGRLWRACLWLISEAKAHNRITEVTEILLDLINQLGADRPLTGATAPEQPSDSSPVPWYIQARNANSDRRDHVA